MKNVFLFKTFILLSFIMIFACKNSGSSEFSFGVIADCQYCNVEGTGVRKYSESDKKLKICVDDFNTMNLEYTVHLGDFIDKDWESFDVVSPIYDKLKSAKYKVLGNHDFSVVDEKKQHVIKRMGLPSAYYQYKVKGWRFVVLNGNDVSYYAYPKDSEEYIYADTYYKEHKITSPKWNGAIGETQLKWLESLLKQASSNDENVILYCHFPVYPQNEHNLWNANEVIDLIEKYNCVKAYVNGHNHEGNYGLKNGVHYLTMKGMVDTHETAYSVFTVTRDSLYVKGFGRELDRVLEIKK